MDPSSSRILEALMGHGVGSGSPEPIVECRPEKTQ